MYIQNLVFSIAHRNILVNLICKDSIERHLINQPKIPGHLQIKTVEHDFYITSLVWEYKFSLTFEKYI